MRQMREAALTQREANKFKRGLKAIRLDVVKLETEWLSRFAELESENQGLRKQLSELLAKEVRA